MSTNNEGNKLLNLDPILEKCDGNLNHKEKRDLEYSKISILSDTLIPIWKLELIIDILEKNHLISRDEVKDHILEKCKIFNLCNDSIEILMNNVNLK